MSTFSGISAPGSTISSSSLLRLGTALTLFFVIVGAKWATIDRFGSAMPDMDQWDAEGLHLLVPWFEGGDFLRELFQPHNEHRVVLTKLQALALVLVGGQWDARLEAVTNALLHAALGVAFWLVACRWLASRWHATLFLLLALLFGLPLAWENVLGGFHSQQYWLLGLSFAAIVALPFVRPWSAGWWAATAAAALALLTMGSGFFAALVVFILSGFRLLRRETTPREIWPTAGVTLVLIAIGGLTRVEAPFHESFKADGAREFGWYVLRSLAWPLRTYDGVGVLLWAPWAALTWRVLRPALFPKPDARSAQTIAALGGWVLLQIAATAYARGAGADYPAPRYTDTLALGVAINAVALAWLLSRQPPRLLHVFSLAWLVTLAVGLSHTIDRTLGHELPARARYYRQAEALLRGFLASNDPAHLAFPDHIPYPSAEALMQRLGHGSLRALLPAEIRSPLPLIGGSAPPSSAFLANHASQLALDAAPRHGLSPRTAPLASLPTWGSFGPEGTATLAEWRSAPVQAALGGWLKLETAGHLGESGATLALHDAATGAVLAVVPPGNSPGDTWRPAFVRAPRQPFMVVARDAAADKWLAFSAPVEMSVVSHLAWQLARHGRHIAAMALALAVLLGALRLLLPRGPSRAMRARLDASDARGMSRPFDVTQS